MECPTNNLVSVVNNEENIFSDFVCFHYKKCLRYACGILVYSVEKSKHLAVEK